MDISDRKTIGQTSKSLGSETSSLDGLEDICKIAEISYASLVFLRYFGSTQSHPFVRTTYPDNWVSHYLQNNYLDIDPTLRHARDNLEPFFWSDIPHNKQNATLMEDAAKFGILPIGYVISTLDKQGNTSVLSLNSAVPQTEWVEFVDEHQSELITLAAQTHEIALGEQQMVQSSNFMKLTKRESEILYWTAEGKSHFEISKILNISENTVHGYAKSARLKLDSVSISQAVARAIRIGLI